MLDTVETKITVFGFTNRSWQSEKNWIQHHGMMWTFLSPPWGANPSSLLLLLAFLLPLSILLTQPRISEESSRATEPHSSTPTSLIDRIPLLVMCKGA